MTVGHDTESTKGIVRLVGRAIAWAVVGWALVGSWLGQASLSVAAGLASFVVWLAIERATDRGRSAASLDGSRFRSTVSWTLRAILRVVEIAVILCAVVILLYALAVVFGVGDFGR